MERALNLITCIKIVTDLFVGNDFESPDDVLSFRNLLIELGYNAQDLKNINMLELLQELCKSFSEMDLKELKEVVDNEGNITTSQ